MFDFDLVFNALLPDPPRKIAVALSGGADSMALTFMLREWCEKHDVALYALHVDHGLRDESEQEAVQVQRWMDVLHIPTYVFSLQTHQHYGEKLHLACSATGNVQEQARIARYGLMTQWCKAHDITHLCVAHHARDQAETVLMRIARGSGIDGLAAMRPVSNRNGIEILRPLLGCDKEDIMSYLNARNHPWIEDPSNHNDDYTRVAIRKMLPQCDSAGLQVKHFVAMASQMARASDCLNNLCKEWILQRACLSNHYYAHIEMDDFTNLHEEMAYRIVKRLLCSVAPQHKDVRFSKLQPLVDAMLEQQTFKKTLGGCVIERYNETYLIYRELSHIMKPALLSERDIMWDNRFKITSFEPSTSWSFGVMGKDGVSQCRKQKIALPDLPATLLHTLPTLFHLENVISHYHIDSEEQSCKLFPHTVEYIVTL